MFEIALLNNFSISSNIIYFNINIILLQETSRKCNMTNKSSHFGSGRPHKQWEVFGERSKREKIKKFVTQHREALSLASARSANITDEKNQAYII